MHEERLEMIEKLQHLNNDLEKTKHDMNNRIARINRWIDAKGK